TARRVVLPGASAEFGQPIVWCAAAGRAVSPDVPISFRIIQRRSALAKPGMPVGRVIWNEIEDQLQAAAVSRVKQLIKVGHHSEYGVDPGVVGYIVAKISHRGRKDRGQPYRVDTKRLQIWQAG